MSCDFQPPSRTFGPAPPPFRLFLATTHLSLVTKSPVVHPLSVQLLTKCSSRNSFVLKTIHLSWVGCTPACTPSSKFVQFKSARVSACLRSIPFLFTFLRTLLRFFALTKKRNSFLFKRVRTLCQKTRGGGGTSSFGRKCRKDGSGRASPPLRED